MINTILLLLITARWPVSVPEFQLEFDEREWSYACENYLEDIYVSAELSYDYVNYQCQFRIRGGKSRSYPKKSIKLELLNGATIFGFDEFNLNAQYLDCTRLRECISYIYYNCIGQIVPEVHFVEVVFNGSTQGAYLSVEDIDEDFLLRTPLPDDAVIYKCADVYSTLDLTDDLDPYSKKTHENQPWDDFILLIYWLRLCPEELFVDQLMDRFYYDDLIACVAANTLLGHGSTYYHNYHLLLDTSGGSSGWRFITWDMDRTWWKYRPALPYHRNSSNNGHRRNVLIWRMWCNEEIREDLIVEIENLQPLLADLAAGNTIDSLATLIAPLVEMDPFRDYTMDEYWTEVDHLKDWPTARYSNLLNQFAQNPLPFRIFTPEFTGGDIEIYWQSAGEQCSWRLAVSPDSMFSDPGDVIYEATPADTFHFLPESYTGEDLWLEVYATRNGVEQRSSNGPINAVGRNQYAIAGNMVINEINYFSSAGFDPGDWFEIISIDANTVSLAGWAVRDNNSTNLTTIGDLLISPGECLVFSSDSLNFASTFDTLPEPSHYLTFHLSNTGDELKLFDPVGERIDSLLFLAVFPWPWQAAGYGSTLMLTDPSLPNEVPSSWIAGLTGGTPFSPAVISHSSLTLNELMARNDTTIADNYAEFDDWIEITNSGPTDINLSGHYLTDDLGDPFKFAFPDTIMYPGDHFIVWVDDQSWQGPMQQESGSCSRYRPRVQ